MRWLQAEAASSIVPLRCGPSRLLIPSSPLPPPPLPPPLFYPSQLVAPEPAVLADPIYGYSSHSQFHFSLAAGYFAWAAVVTAMYRGSKLSVLHHATCCLVYMFALTPFLHHIGNIYLLFQASSLVLDTYSVGKLLVSKHTTTNLTLKFIHPFVFVLSRIVVGLPLSVVFLKDMAELLQSGNAHSEKVVYFFIAVNVLINALNVYWTIGMALGMNRKNRPACSVDEKAASLNWFDIGFVVSFGKRETPHQRPKASRKKKATGYDNTCSPASTTATSWSSGPRLRHFASSTESSTTRSPGTGRP